MRALNYCVVAIIQIGKILQLPHCISGLRKGREEPTKSFLVTGFHFLYYASHLPVYSKAISCPPYLKEFAGQIFIMENQ